MQQREPAASPATTGEGSSVVPSREQLRSFAERPEGPFTMINLLRFKRAEDGNTTRAIRQYARYMENAAPLVQEAGGRLVWQGPAHEVFIGAESDAWDCALLVEYPSRGAFLAMVMAPHYLAIARDREAALERTVMLVAPVSSGAFPSAPPSSGEIAREAP